MGQFFHRPGGILLKVWIIFLWLFAGGQLHAQESNVSQVDILLVVDQDGGIEGGFNGADPLVDGTGNHTPGQDGPSDDGSIPAERNNVVRTFDAIRYLVHWSVNDIDSAVENNGTDAVVDNLTITLDTKREDVRWIYLPEICGDGSGIGDGSEGNDTVLTCTLGTKREGTVGSISPVAKVYAKANGDPSNDDVVVMQATIDTNQTDPKASNEVNTTISGKPNGDWIKGDAEYYYHTDNNGTDGVIFVYPLTFVPGGETLALGSDPLDDSYEFDFYDHAWDLGDNATVATAEMMADINRSWCGGYDGHGAYPYGYDGGDLPSDATAENTTHSFSVSCDDATGQGSSASNGDYPMVHIEVSDYSTRVYPPKNADGTTNKNRVIAMQVAFWVPNSEIENRLAQDPPPPFWNTINADDMLDTTDADAEEDTVPYTDPIQVGVAGTGPISLRTIDEVTIGDNSVSEPLFTIDDPLAANGGEPGGGSSQRVNYKHHAIFYPGPYQQVYSKDPDTGLEYVAFDARLESVEGKGLFSSTNWTGTGGVPRSEIVTLQFGLFATTQDSTAMTSDPIHLCGEIDNRHMDVVNIPDTFERYEVADEQINKGSQTIGTSTGSPTDGIANVIFGDRINQSSMWWVNKDYPYAIRTNPADVPAYVVEVTNAPLDINYSEHGLTCSDGDAGDAGWVDVRDIDTLKSEFSSDPTPDIDGFVHYDKITRVRVRMLEHRFWTNTSETTQYYNGLGFLLHMQARVRPDVDEDPDGTEIYLHASRARGDWNTTSGNPPLNTDCTKKDMTNSATYAFDENLTPTGWCRLEYSTANEESYDDFLTTLDAHAFERFVTDDVDGDGFDEVTSIRISHSDKINIVGSMLHVTKKLVSPVDTLLKDGDLATFKITAYITGSPDDWMSDVYLEDKMISEFEYVSHTWPVDREGNALPNDSDHYVNCYYKANWRKFYCQFTKGYDSSNPKEDYHYRASPFYAEFNLTVRITDPHANAILFNQVQAKAKRIENGEVSSTQIVKTAAASVPIIPRYNEFTLRKDVPDLNGSCLNDPGYSAVQSNTLLPGDCSMFEINGEYSYDLTYTNNGNDYLNHATIIDVLPYLQDTTEGGAGDGVTPESNFSGTSTLVSITPSNSNTVVECTTDDPNTINRDPALNTNTWSTTCDASATGFRVTENSAMDVGETRTIHLVLKTEGNKQNDIYTNTFGAKVDEIPLSARSNDVSAMVQALSLGSTVWFDVNNNGLQESGESGIAGVEVQLFREGDDPTTATPIDTNTTNADGLYLFENLPEGNYFVYIPTPPALAPLSSSDIATTADPNNDTDGDDNGIQSASGQPVTSNVITLTIGGEPSNEDNSGSDMDDNTTDNVDREHNGNMSLDFGFVIADMGDAPESYQTTLATNGARHILTGNGLSLGSVVDAEADGFPTDEANGDDNNGSTDDEDAITPPLIPVADSSGNTLTSYTLSNIAVTNNSGADTYLVAYIDFNGDGDFNDSGEQSATVVVPDGATTASATFSGIGSIVTGDTYIRLRLSSDQDAVESPAGTAPDGEIEDHTATIVPVVRLEKEIHPSSASDTFDLNLTDGNQTASFANASNGDGTIFMPYRAMPLTLTETSHASSAVYLSDTVCKDGNGNILFDLNSSPRLDPGASLTQDVNFTTKDSSAASNTITCRFVNTKTITGVVTKGVSINDGTNFTFNARVEYSGRDQNESFELDGDLNDTEGDNDGVDFEKSQSIFATEANITITEVATPGWKTAGVSCEVNGTQLSADEMGIGSLVFPTDDNVTVFLKNVTNEDEFRCAFENTKMLSLGSVVWVDADQDGVQDADEVPIEKALVTLLDLNGSEVLDSDGNPVTIRTDENGSYYFNDLVAGTYRVKVTFDENTTTPEGVYVLEHLEPTPVQNTNPNDGNNSDSNVDTGTIDTNSSDTTWYSAAITLDGNETTGEVRADGSDDQPGQEGREDDSGNMTLDLGFYEPRVSVGSLVWEDIDNNGIQDSNESGIAGAIVTLYNADGTRVTDENGTVIPAQTTDTSGTYYFDNLPEGDYFVEVNMSATAIGYLPGSTQNSDANDSVVDDSNIAEANTTTQIYRSGLFTLTPGGESNETGGLNGSDAMDDAQELSGDMTIDFGFFPALSLGSLVWEDSNNNGIQDADERGIADVNVTLLDSNGDPVQDAFGNPVSPVVTDANGTYYFGNLPEGSYRVMVTMPEGYAPSRVQNSADDHNGTDSDIDSAFDTGDPQAFVSGVVALTLGEESNASEENSSLPDSGDEADDIRELNGDMTVDFGFYKAVSIGSTVWLDVNNNGKIDDGESGIADVNVTLYRDSNNNGQIDLDELSAPVASMLTDSNGSYYFGDLMEGNYTVIIATPPATAPRSSTTTVEVDDNGSVDSDDNGIQVDSGDAVRSPMIELVAGEESTGEDAAYGGTLDDNARDANGDMTIDFGFYNPVSIGSTVWFDANDNGLIDSGESGIANVNVTLYAVASDGSRSAVATTATDSDGNYYFGDLTEGDYVVGVAPPQSAPLSSTVTDSSDDDVDNNDDGNQTTIGAQTFSGVIHLSVDDENASESGLGASLDDDDDNNGNMTVDFGFFNPVSIGSTVWFDSNANGVIDANESGIVDVNVTLYAEDGTTVVATTRTDENGTYFFGNLPEGDYIVGVTPPANAPLSSPGNDGDTQADDNDNGIQSAPGQETRSSLITLKAGDEPTGETGRAGDQDDSMDGNGDMTVDFGFYNPVSIGSTVWEDANNNGIQDNNESGIAGVSVALYYDANGNGVIDGDESTTAYATTTTDSEGNYLFSQLPEGSYQVVVTPDSDYPLSSTTTTTTDNGVDGDDNGEQSASGEKTYSPMISLRVGDEPDNTTETSQGGTLDDNLTDANGDMSVDFGFFNPDNFVSIGSLIWEDSNNNGIQDANESGLADANVTLLDGNGMPVTKDGFGNDIETITTDESGTYYFGDLLPGDYKVQVVVPEIYMASSEQTDEDNNDTADDSNIAEANTTTNTYISGLFTLSAGDEPTATDENSDMNATGDDADDSNDEAGNMTVDFGFHKKPVSIGSLVWEDRNGNGIQDAGEPPLEGAIVTLLDAEGNPVVDYSGSIVADINTSDTNGTYLFDNLPEGNYTIKVTPPAGYVGVVDANSSDDHNATDNNLKAEDNGSYLSPVIELVNNEEPTTADENSSIASSGDDADDANDTNGDMTVDFGFFQSVSIGDLVWYDDNRDGIQDVNESGVEGVRVYLLDADGNRVKDANGSDLSVETNASGYYLFEGLEPGVYAVEFDLSTLLEPYVPTDRDTGDDESLDSDADSVTGITDPVALVSGDIYRDLDMGIVKGEGSLSGNVSYEDANGDRHPLSGVTIQLLYPDGSPVLDANGSVIEVTTNADGNYYIAHLLPGDYLIVEVQPDGYYDLSKNPGGADDDNTTVIDSLNMISVTVDGGENDVQNDFVEVLPASLGDYVWYDEDNSGTQDTWEEGVEGVEVILKSATGQTWTTTTDQNGYYRFDDLDPTQSYEVTFNLSTLPEGYIPTEPDLGDSDEKDSDADAEGKVSTVSLVSGEHNPTIDMGIRPEGATDTLKYLIGTHFWIDDNGDGEYDPATDRPVEGAKVELLNADGEKLYWVDAAHSDLTTEVTEYPAEVYTDEDGSYHFYVPEGTYQVRFDLPPYLEAKGYDFSGAGTHADNDDNRINQNDVDVQTGLTRSVSVGPDRRADLTLDAALECPCADIVSDSSDAMNIWILILMLLGTLLIGRGKREKLPVEEKGIS